MTVGRLAALRTVAAIAGRRHMASSAGPVLLGAWGMVAGGRCSAMCAL